MDTGGRQKRGNADGETEAPPPSTSQLRLASLFAWHYIRIDAIPPVTVLLTVYRRKEGMNEGNVTPIRDHLLVNSYHEKQFSFLNDLQEVRFAFDTLLCYTFSQLRGYFTG